jgi:C4-dicarboxylate-specific signal transduction histidine kinase
MGGILMLSEDITDVVESDAKFNQDSKMVALSLLSSGVAHEIKSPLSVIAGTIASLMSKLTTGSSVAPERLATDLGKIYRCANKIESIVSDLSTLTKDGSTDPFTSCSVTQIVRQVTDGFQSRSKNEGVLLKINEFDKNLFVFGQNQQLSQILINMISNAFDSAKGNLHAWVKVEVTTEYKRLRLTVTDSGAGVPEEIEKKIFTPFFTTKQYGKGTGLGLSISQSIAEKHGGSLKLDRRISPNAFVLDLPLSEAQSKSDPKTEGSAA